MQTAKVFNSGRSQAVRIPKEYRFDVDEVFINRIGETVVLTPVYSLADSFDLGVSMVSEDFLPYGKPESRPSEREEL